MQIVRQIPPTVAVACASVLVVAGSTRSRILPIRILDSTEPRLIDRLLLPDVLAQSILGLVLLSLLLIR